MIAVNKSNELKYGSIRHEVSVVYRNVDTGFLMYYSFRNCLSSLLCNYKVWNYERKWYQFPVKLDSVRTRKYREKEDKRKNRNRIEYITITIAIAIDSLRLRTG